MFSWLFSNTVFTLVALFGVLIYFYVRYLYSYWERRGVPYLKPSFPFGNFGKTFKQQLSFGEQLDELYRSTTEPFIGVFGLFRPTLLACDPDFVRNVLIKDFQYFSDRGVYVDEKNDPLSGHLFSLEGERWKNLRVKLTPTFTSGKMRAIFSTLLDCKDPLQKYMDKETGPNKSVEVRELTARFTMNVIASVAFGIEIDCFADPDNPFRKYGRKVLEMSFKNGFRALAFVVCPKLLTWTGVRGADRDVEEFFFDMVRQTLEMREKHDIVRKDFFQLLVQLRNSGTIQLDDEWQTKITNDNEKALTIEEVTAQAFIFYLAGFETSSTTMSYCLYEIAKNTEIQRKVQEEIDTVLVKHDGKLTYESITELKYLECCIDETLRKYPALPFLNRECIKEYNVPGSNITIEKGTPLLIPVLSLHRDERYYPNPDKFDPTRFLNENKSGKTIVDMPYLPFGDGPRNCIGLRMGKMTTKVGVASMLQKFSVELGDEHVGKELKFSSAANILTPTSGIHLKFRTRKEII